jgi:hypothetical protein
VYSYRAIPVRVGSSIAKKPVAGQNCDRVILVAGLSA